MRFFLVLCGFAGPVIFLVGVNARNPLDALHAIAAGIGVLVFAVALGLADLINVLYQVRNGAWHTAEVGSQVHAAVQRVGDKLEEANPL